jgi:hypothetical protein
MVVEFLECIAAIYSRPIWHNVCFQTGSGAHPASYPMGTGGPFPGGKARPGRDADHSPPPSAITSMACSGTAYIAIWHSVIFWFFMSISHPRNFSVTCVTQVALTLGCRRNSRSGWVGLGGARQPEVREPNAALLSTHVRLFISNSQINEPVCTSVLTRPDNA